MEKPIIELLKTYNNDLIIFDRVNRSEPYKESLMLHAIDLKRSGIHTYEEFTQRTDFDAGVFTYQELTYFDRMKDEQYSELISEMYNTMVQTLKTKYSKDYGDNTEGVMFPRRYR